MKKLAIIMISLFALSFFLTNSVLGQTATPSPTSSSSNTTPTPTTSVPGAPATGMAK